MFPSGNLTGFDNNRQPVFIQGDSQIQINSLESNQVLNTSNQDQRSHMFSKSQNNRQVSRMISTSDEENNNDNPWQTISVKRKKTNNENELLKNDVPTSNRYSSLTNHQEESEANNNVIEERSQKPPPIFVYGVKDYLGMINAIKGILNQDQYFTKTMADNIVKINATTPEAYRVLAKYMKDKNIVHHTYQPKENRAYRVVIKHLHHTTEVQDIKNEIETMGHKVRNILNIKHKQTKEPLNMFFVDLEPAKNNKDVYSIKGLQNRIIEIEPPRGDKNIAQCLRCQMYGHTKSYCNRPYVCVKCGGQHDTRICKKSKDTPATCALCGGPHPANYRGCDYYQKHHKNNKLKTLSQNQQTAQPVQYPVQQQQQKQPTNNPRQQYSYANAVNGQTSNRGNEENIGNVLTTFLEEFKNMFNQLIQQNTMVINMLTMLMSKMK